MYHYKSYELFRVAKIPLEETNVGNRGTFECRTVTDIENRNMNATFSGAFKFSSDLEHSNLWIYGMDIYVYGYMDGTFLYTDKWRENIYIQMRTKSGTYKSMV